VACVIQLQDTEEIVHDGYCDLTMRPDSARVCWPADCPEHIPTSPTAVAVITEAGQAVESTAHWRSGLWGHVMITSFLTHLL